MRKEAGYEDWIADEYGAIPILTYLREEDGDKEYGCGRLGSLEEIEAWEKKYENDWIEGARV